MKKSLIDFKNLSVRRGLRVALKSINLQISLGENVAIIGPNGSGKSTLIKIITRECYPSAGSVKIMGQEIWDVFELRSHLGIITQDLMHMCRRDITAREMVLTGFFSSAVIWRNHNVSPFMEKEAQKFLTFLEADYLSKRLMTDMSSGEAQRVLIARALVHHPKALILDEPTNSLDMKAAAIFKRTLHKIARAGKNIILVTHNLQDLLPEMKRVVLLREGKIFKDGPKENVLTSRNLSRLFDIPVSL